MCDETKLQYVDSPIPDDSLIDTQKRYMAHVTINGESLSLPIVDTYSYDGKEYKFCCHVSDEYAVYVIDGDELVTDTQLLQAIQDAYNAEVKS